VLAYPSFAELFSQARRPLISFEVFPPKTEAGLARLIRVLRGLTALRPDFFTVTYGAFGTTRVHTLEIASHLRGQYHVLAACHLTCVGASRAELDQILARYHAAGIHHLVALRGDPPQGAAGRFVPPPDGCANAEGLVRHIHGFSARTGCGAFSISVAGYPEKQPEAPDLATDLAHLERKVAAGAELVTTQLFFDNAFYFRFVAAARTRGIRVPILPGLMPILSAAQVRRICPTCGTSVPAALRAELDAVSGDESKTLDLGVRHCLAQARELLEGGAPGIHFYVLNQFEAMRRILPGLRRWRGV
jgi:methylenetetrahydrofolate reductase (NADPH)